MSLTFEDFVAVLLQIPELIERTKRIERSVDQIKKSTAVPIYYTIEDICRYLEVSRATLYRKPWILPNFGKADLPGRKKKYLITTCELWFSVPLSEHEAAWNAMTPAERRRILDEVREKKGRAA